jgi:hypothetical protein
MRDDFAVLILTHGRANNVKTFNTLKKQGYTGKIYLVIDDEDSQEKKYREKYGNQVYKFCKQDYINRTDVMCAEEYRKVVVYARNACWDIAKDIGVNYFCVLDDDYTRFEGRYVENNKLMTSKFKNLDAVFDAFIKFLDDSNAITVCMAQGGDFIGGVKSGTFSKKLLRKAMNVWFMRTDKPFKFMGRINEDTNMYVTYGQRGALMFTATEANVVQTRTQKQEGGLTDVYLHDGTYVKSFFSVMAAPSCVKVASMGDKHMRMHHSISWNNCTPMIVNEKYKKCGER